MSKIRFTRTIAGGLHVQVPVHTNVGLCTATVTMPLENPEVGFSAAEARAAMQELFRAIGATRIEADKARIGGES